METKEQLTNSIRQLNALETRFDEMITEAYSNAHKWTADADKPVRMFGEYAGAILPNEAVKSYKEIAAVCYGINARMKHLKEHLLFRIKKYYPEVKTEGTSR